MAFSIKKQANLNLKKNTTFKIPRTAVAPTTLPLGTPTLYFSGISLADGGDWSGMTFDNPWSWAVFGGSSWDPPNFIGQLYHDGTAWNLQIQGFYIPYGFNTSRLACKNTAPSTSLPLFGWVNEPWVIAGTLVISTTP